MKITCITPTYNRYTLLDDCIDMFLNQSHKDKELIIVDDSTHDIPNSILQKINHYDTIIKHIILSKKRTIGYKRNLAVRFSTGDYIAFWDDDDIHFPNRLRLQSQLLLRSHKDICVIDSNSALYYFENRFERIPATIHDRWWKYGYLCPSIMFKREMWKRIKFRHVNDKEDIIFIEQSKGDVVIYDRKQYIFAYRVNPNGVSNIHSYLY